MFQSMFMSSVTSSVNQWLAAVTGMLMSSSGLLAVAAVFTALYLLRALSKKLKDKLGVGLVPILAVAFLAFAFFSLRNGGGQKLYNRLPPSLTAKKARDTRQKLANRQAGREVDAMIGGFVASVPPVVAPPLMAPNAPMPHMPSLPHVAPHRLPTLPSARHQAAIHRQISHPQASLPIVAAPSPRQAMMPTPPPVTHSGNAPSILNDPIIIPPGAGPSAATSKQAAMQPTGTPQKKLQTATAAQSFAELVPHSPPAQTPQLSDTVPQRSAADEIRHTVELRRKRREARDATRYGDASGGLGSSPDLGATFDRPAVATGRHAASNSQIANHKPQAKHGTMPSHPMAQGHAGMGMNPHAGNQMPTMPFHPGFGGMGMNPGMGMHPGMGGGHMQGMGPQMPAMPPHLGGSMHGGHLGGHR